MDSLISENFYRDPDVRSLRSLEKTTALQWLIITAGGNMCGVVDVDPELFEFESRCKFEHLEALQKDLPDTVVRISPTRWFLPSYIRRNVKGALIGTRKDGTTCPQNMVLGILKAITKINDPEVTRLVGQTYPALVPFLSGATPEKKKVTVQNTPTPPPPSPCQGLTKPLARAPIGKDRIGEVGGGEDGIGSEGGLGETIEQLHPGPTLPLGPLCTVPAPPAGKPHSQAHQPTAAEPRDLRRLRALDPSWKLTQLTPRLLAALHEAKPMLAQLKPHHWKTLLAYRRKELPADHPRRNLLEQFLLHLDAELQTATRIVTQRDRKRARPKTNRGHGKTCLVTTDENSNHIPTPEEVAAIKAGFEKIKKLA